ncbi:hypothetical protein Anapl_13256 [Anas platyrhynchos]|uniref:Secreted protein n=1 Tax=Anas platyrhynchos TaxID=8839 RepID=R0J9R4_ANAPL|nr:hypothetical protein Anapl_13256 [Anas platyrhynchos]
MIVLVNFLAALAVLQPAFHYEELPAGLEIHGSADGFSLYTQQSQGWGKGQEKFLDHDHAAKHPHKSYGWQHSQEQLGARETPPPGTAPSSDPTAFPAWEVDFLGQKLHPRYREVEKLGEQRNATISIHLGSNWYENTKGQRQNRATYRYVRYNAEFKNEDVCVAVQDGQMQDPQTDCILEGPGKEG